MSVVVVVYETHTPRIVIWWMLWLLCLEREGSGWQRWHGRSFCTSWSFKEGTERQQVFVVCYNTKFVSVMENGKATIFQLLGEAGRLPDR
jgi:hypothetical protein